MPIISIVEWLALGCSLFLLHPRANKGIILLLPVMMIVVTVETVGYYVRIRYGANGLFYNVSVPFVILLLLRLVRQNLRPAPFRRFVDRMMPVYVVFCLFNFFVPLPVTQHFASFCTYNYIAGAFCLAIACSFYLYQFINKPEEQVIYADEVFWITVAVMCLYAPKSVLFAVFPYFTHVHPTDYAFNHTWNLINISLNIIFYGILCYVCVCRLIFRKLTGPLSSSAA